MCRPKPDPSAFSRSAIIIMFSRTLFASATRQLARPTPTPTAAALAQCRSFHTTLPAPASYKARKGMISAVRVVSKRARAAKEKRKAAVLQRLDHTTKMKINDALDVLQVRFPANL